MRLTFRAQRSAATWVLPLALWTAVPSVQWCSVDWSRVCAQTMLVCSVVPRATDCAARCATTCDGGSCPAAADSPEGRAYCLDGPNGGDAELTNASFHHAPDVLLAWTPIVDVDHAELAVAQRTLPLESRPPPRQAPSRRPPARAPPSLPSV